MARTHVGPVVKIALSPTKVATATDLDYRRVILPAILAGDLGPIYRINNKRRLLISDVEAWLRKFPHHTGAKA